MARAGSSKNDAQIPLLFSDDCPDPHSESALRAAFKQTATARRMSFEQAMADPLIAICIRNAAEATAKRIRESKT